MLRENLAEGKDWDEQLEKLGATRLVDRVDCDVDYDAMADAWLADALAHMGAVDGDIVVLGNLEFEYKK